MFIWNFLNGNPNFMVTLVTKVMLRVQVNNENGNPRDQDRDMHIWKNELLPVLVPVVAVLIVHLDPWHGFCHPCNLKIRIPIEKLAYKHVLHACLKKWTTPCPGPWGSRCHRSRLHETFETSKFGFPLKNWHINMCHIHIWKKWITPCSWRWGCRSQWSPGRPGRSRWHLFF